MTSTKINGLIIRRYEGRFLDSNCYVINEDDRTLVIDPNDSEEYLNDIKGKVTVLLTHEHYDHICGLNKVREAFESKVVCSKDCSERMQDPKKNLSSMADAILAFYEKREIWPTDMQPFSCDGAEVTFDGGYILHWGTHEINCKIILGHTKGSACYIMDGKLMFSGDELLPIPTITRFPTGSTKIFRNIELPWFKEIASQISMVFPGHREPGNIEPMIEVNGFSGNTNG